MLAEIDKLSTLRGGKTAAPVGSHSDASAPKRPCGEPSKREMAVQTDGKVRSFRVAARGSGVRFRNSESGTRASVARLREELATLTE